MKSMKMFLEEMQTESYFYLYVIISHDDIMTRCEYVLCSEMFLFLNE